MIHSSSRSHRRAGPVFYVPESFHPEERLPVKLLPHTQSAYYLMHAIMLRVAYKQREGARLKKQYLENVMGRWACQPILSCLLEHGEIQRVGQYVSGKQCFQYLPAEQYRAQRLRRFHPTNPDLLERLARARQLTEEQNRRNWCPIHDVWERWQWQLRVEWDQAHSIITQMPVESNPYDVQTLMVERIAQGKYRLKVDDYGRVHNAISSLSRALRPSLRMHDQSLSHVDIVNSQPALLSVLMKAHCGQDRETGESPGGGQSDQLSIYDRRGFSPSEGVLEYGLVATDGQLYEHLMERTGLPRTTVKRALLRDVFGRRRWYPSTLDETFRTSFPDVHRFVRCFHGHDHAALLRELQRVESDLVIHRVGGRLQNLGCTGCVSLHDAVFCARGDVGLVERAFRDEMKTMGVTLKLEVAA